MHANRNVKLTQFSKFNFCTWLPKPIKLEHHNPCALSALKKEWDRNNPLVDAMEQPNTARVGLQAFGRELQQMLHMPHFHRRVAEIGLVVTDYRQTAHELLQAMHTLHHLSVRHHSAAVQGGRRKQRHQRNKKHAAPPLRGMKFASREHLERSGGF